MAVTSRHNKYSSMPDWFGTQSNETVQSSPTVSQFNPIGTQQSGSNVTVDFNNIPIDKQTIVWNNDVLEVPIDNQKIIWENPQLI